MTITAGSLAAAGPASAAATNYVALGDSYSSGTGAGSYDPASGNCKRSANAYPKLWAAANSPASFNFAACSGATTSSVASGQLGALSSSTSFVSITVGGNDAGFAKVMETCVLQSTSSCETAVANAETFMRNTLPGRLDSLYGSIRSKSPSARVVVLGYPRLYIPNSSGCVGLNQTKRAVLNRAADTLNTSVSGAVSRAGFVFSDVRDEFSGHELCSGHDWLHSLTYPIGDSYHPTARGQANGYLPGLNSAVNRSLALRKAG
ncbi:SGNH/GDSL hydrolase family protein [Actinomadura viridis]|uniref:SGNH/GDSL hydrolase family protein n=1 Tax=Actinomadura viridis TaxID=58110 RepID=UPI003693FE25